MVIPGSMAVVLLGLLAAWWGDVPFTGDGNWWLLTSLLLFVAIGLLVPTVFLPRGKVFERAFEDARPGGRSRPSCGPRSTTRRCGTPAGPS